MLHFGHGAVSAQVAARGITNSPPPPFFTLNGKFSTMY